MSGRSHDTLTERPNVKIYEGKSKNSAKSGVGERNELRVALGDVG